MLNYDSILIFPKESSHGKIIWNAGELATARAAASAGTIMVSKITLLVAPQS